MTLHHRARAALVIALWIGGAGEPAVTASNAPGDTWWSLAPLKAPPVPSGMAPAGNPVDAFIRVRLAAEGLSPSPEADRRTLIRRLSFDLLGLPPDPDSVDAFVADASPGAYERLVDRWLASPQYGERWARHWLDVVHYGETHGYDKDQPRPNAWPYRDYVIRAFNEDRPFARFVQEQLAGDVLFPGTRDGFEALGFIAAGPWDLIGHAEVPESKMDGQVARHLDRDDMVANTIQTFNSLTIQCAQCHAHKFDPISQEDYYRLQAVFAAVDRADQKYDHDPEVARHRTELHRRELEVAARQRAVEEGLHQRAGPQLAELDVAIANREARVRQSEAYGYHSHIEKRSDVTKWVQVDLGQTHSLTSIVLHPARDAFNGIGEGFGFPVRYRVEVGEGPALEDNVILGDFSEADVPNPKLKPVTLDAAGRRIRWIRITALELAPRQDDFIFALAEVSAVTAEGRNVARGAAVTAMDSIEAPVRWQQTNLTDGWYPGMPAGTDPELKDLKSRRTALLASAKRPEEQDVLDSCQKERDAIAAASRALPPQSVAYVAAVHSGSGAFVGTGGRGGQPRTIRVLSRGSIQKPGAEVAPGTLRCVIGLPGDLELPPDHREGDRRAALARWISHPANALTWRSIVNRVWQYHFGRGLVETPNDFGRMGGLPSHPELLDWLAATFRDGPQSLKSLHRLIVTSATYRQQSSERPEASRLDDSNVWLWRMNRRKLEAEAVRDSILAASGNLDLRMGGPSFRDFVVEKPEHSPHYEYGLHNPSDPAALRRTIYRWIVRSQPQPFLTTLDCADPSMQVARRNESASPLQALAVLNNALVIQQSRGFAHVVAARTGGAKSRVVEAHRRALGRPPTPEEASLLAAHLEQHGLTNLCRVLLNLNEFSFVD